MTDARDEHAVAYQRALPPIVPTWEAYPPLPELGPSDNWVEIREAGDPLVRIDEQFFCTAAQWRRGWPGTSPYTYTRGPVAAALTQAEAALPAVLGLSVLDAHRSLETQRFLYQRAYSDSALPAGFVADPNDARIVPPHTTGAALDVMLTWRGQPLALGTAPGEYVDASLLAALEGTPGAAQALRRVLYHTMLAAGFRGIPEEWWHYSLGDQ